MEELKEDKLTQVANDSLEVIRRFYKVKGPVDTNAYAKVRIASSMFGAFVKYRQHQSNLNAVKVAVASQVLDNNEDRELYLRLSAPELGLAKIKESKLLKAGIGPESIKPKVVHIDEQGYIER